MSNRVNYYERSNRYAKNDTYGSQKQYTSNTYSRAKPSYDNTFYRGYDNYRQDNKVTKTVPRPIVPVSNEKIVTCQIPTKKNESKTPKVTFSREALMKLMTTKVIPTKLVNLNFECIDLKTNCLAFYKQIKLPEELDNWQRGAKIDKLDHHSNGYIIPQKRVSNNDDELLKLKKDIKVVLNRMTPENFDICLKEITNLNIGFEDGLNSLVDELVVKATLEPSYSPIYARFCSRIGNIEVSDKSFRARLLKRCQTMFMKPLNVHMEEARLSWLEKVSKEVDERMKKMYMEGTEEQVLKAKDKYFGNLRFLSELYLQKQLSGKIVLKCIADLTNDNANSDTIDGACTILPVCGKSLEANFPEDVQKLILNLTILSKSTKFERKSRFKLMDIIDMRNRKWELRDIQKLKNVAPKTLDEIKEEKETVKVISKNTNFQKAPSTNAWRPRTNKY